MTAGNILTLDRSRPKRDIDSDLRTMFSFGAEINSIRLTIVVVLNICLFFSKFQNSTELFIHIKVKIRSKSMSYSILREIIFYLTSSRKGRITLFTHRLPLTLDLYTCPSINMVFFYVKFFTRGKYSTHLHGLFISSFYLCGLILYSSFFFISIISNYSF